MTTLIINGLGILLMLAIVWWFWLYPLQVPRKSAPNSQATSPTEDADQKNN